MSWAVIRHTHDPVSALVCPGSPQAWHRLQLLKEKKRRKLLRDFISPSVCVSLCNFNDLQLYITK